MFSAIEVSRYFLSKTYENDLEITNMKLQKLLYYSQVLYLIFFDQPLFKDEIQAWELGPVCSVPYHEYKIFSGNPLPPVPPSEVTGYFDSESMDILDKVWDLYGRLGAFQLSDMTHSEEPWLKARAGLAPNERSNKTILIKDIKSLGQKIQDPILDLIERSDPNYSRDIEEAITSVMKDDTIEPLEPGKAYEWLSSISDFEDPDF